MRYEVLYQPAFSLAVVALERGEQIMAESGAMVSMSPTIKLEAKMSGGGVFGALKSAVGGESMFRTTFTAESGPGEITFAPSMLGDIMAVELTGNRFFVQPGSYLAGHPGLVINVQGSVRGMLSGEGLFLLTVQGSGLLLLSSFGAIHSKMLGPGEEYVVDTGHIVAFEESVQYRLEKATGKSQGVGGFLKGMVQSALSGEGFVCRYQGPGRIYIQTRQLPGFAHQLLPFLPKSRELIGGVKAEWPLPRPGVQEKGRDRCSLRIDGLGLAGVGLGGEVGNRQGGSVEAGRVDHHGLTLLKPLGHFKQLISRLAHLDLTALEAVIARDITHIVTLLDGQSLGRDHQHIVPASGEDLDLRGHTGSQSPRHGVELHEGDEVRHFAPIVTQRQSANRDHMAFQHATR